MYILCDYSIAKTGICIETSADVLDCLGKKTGFFTSPQVFVNEVHWNEEYFLVIISVFVNYTFLRIQAFIEMNVYALLKRDHYLTTLKNANQDLQRQLRRFANSFKINY